MPQWDLLSSNLVMIWASFVSSVHRLIRIELGEGFFLLILIYSQLKLIIHLLRNLINHINYLASASNKIHLKSCKILPAVRLLTNKLHECCLASSKISALHFFATFIFSFAVNLRSLVSIENNKQVAWSLNNEQIPLNWRISS